LETGESFYEDLLQTFQNKTKNDNGCHFTEGMIDKDFVAYTEFGNSREYYPLVKKTTISQTCKWPDTNFSTIPPHSSLPSSPPKPIYHQRN
jgi:hypothetical protein